MDIPVKFLGKPWVKLKRWGTSKNKRKLRWGPFLNPSDSIIKNFNLEIETNFMYESLRKIHFLHPDNTVVCQVRNSRVSLITEVEEVEGDEGEEGAEGLKELKEKLLQQQKAHLHPLKGKGDA
ncbi:MAG: hypothetical protein CM15mP83_3160 [Flavobacteriaceae bacterium]|nr:MAG: hypothetical protein CM15mP83_3160 [Flavobacteriaceae bacterium]